MTAHPKRETLDEFIRGGLSDDEAEPIETHLQQEPCTRCLFEARELMAEAEPELRENLRRFAYRHEHTEKERSEGLEAAIRQALRRGAVLEAERRLAPTLVAELDGRSPVAKPNVVRTVSRYQLFGLAEHLSHESREQGFRDVARALELAQLGVVVADSLDPRIYVSTLAADQRALARAYLGNARRIASDLPAAEDAFQQALLVVEQGSKVSPVRAEIGSLLGSLRIDQCRYLEARTVLGEALRLYHSFRFRREEGKVLTKLASVEGYDGHPERAVEILHEAVATLEEAGEAGLCLWASHNLTYFLVDTGDALEALARYEKARPLYEEHCEEPTLRLRQRWLEGRIYAALGDFELAKAAFEEVRSMAAERALAYELAESTLELAILNLNRGDVARVQDLAEEITPILRSHELHRHALAAMYLFRQAARTQTATEGSLREILRYLQRARNNPFLRFEPSARWG